MKNLLAFTLEERVMSYFIRSSCRASDLTPVNWLFGGVSWGVMCPQADVAKVTGQFGCSPQYRFVPGLAEPMPCYVGFEHSLKQI